MKKSIVERFVRKLLPVILVLVPFCTQAQDKILFIRGGSGTVGFFEGGSDEQGASVFNYLVTGGNHGWGELGAALVAEGYMIEEISEDNPTPDSPVPLDTMNLSDYKVIVFGSNNAPYTTAQVTALQNYITGGGAALFISDANFGSDWPDAPTSDSTLLAPYGISVNQDRGTYQINRANHFLDLTHPIFSGVNTFDGEGVSPGTVDDPMNASSPVILSRVPNGQLVRRNNTSSGQGTSTAASVSDGTLIIATPGSGRIAVHFDRNTFFNQNGAGTNINRFDNEAYARNLFNWLAGQPTGGDYAPRAHFPDIPIGSVLEEGDPILAIAKDPDGTVIKVELLIDQNLVSEMTTAPYQWFLPAGLASGSHTLTARVTDNDGLITDASIEFLVVGVADMPVRLDRDGWMLSSNRTPDKLGLAIDDDIDTRWSTEQAQEPGQFFEIDFGSRQLFERIVLETPGNPNDYPRGYMVQGSDDQINYTDLISGNGDEPTTEIKLNRSVTYRYLRIVQTGSSGSNWWSIHEINVFAPAPNTVLSLDTWQEFYFADSPPSLLTDSDGDGSNELLEFAFKSDPTDLTAKPPIVVSPPNGNTVSLSFPRWKGGNGLIYEVQASLDLNDWETVAATVTEVGTPADNQDGTETATFEAVFETDPSLGFIRILVSQP